MPSGARVRHSPGLTVVFGAFLVVTLLATGVAAQEPVGSTAVAKVAVIDVQRLVFESAAGKEALERLKNLQEQKVAESKALQQEIQELKSRVDDGRLSLSEEAIAELEKPLQEKLIEYQRFKDDAEKVLQQEQDQAFTRIEDEMMPVITLVAKEQQYTVVFNKFNSGLLFAVDEVDITDQVLERFNEGNQGGE
jgi:outer membrane protein